jgi:hypothetical protein
MPRSAAMRYYRYGSGRCGPTKVIRRAATAVRRRYVQDFRPSGHSRSVVCLAMYKFSFGAVAWAAMMYLFLSEFTNILA